MTIDWPELAALADFGEEPAYSAPAPVVIADSRRCTGHNARTGLPCKAWAIKGGTVCWYHGGSAPQVREKARQRAEAAEALALARKTAGDIDLSAFSDPFAALETALGHQHALALRLLALVEAIPDDQLRYRGKIGEQLRGEVIAAQTALRDLRGAAEGAMRLNLADRRVQVSERQIDLMERAMRTTLQQCGLDLDGQDKALQILARELRAIEQ